MTLSWRNPSEIDFCQLLTFSLKNSASVMSVFCVTVSFMSLFYTVPHLCLQYSTHGNKEFGSTDIPLHLCVRSEKNSEKEEKKRDNAGCDLII